MKEGKIVEYIEEGRIVSTLCLQEKGSRLHVLTPMNREINLSPKRAILISENSCNISRPREQLLETLKEIERNKERLKAKVDVQGLWELIRDEGEDFDSKYLAELCFGDELNDDHVSATLRALFEDRLYFKLKNGKLIPNTEHRVEEILKQRKEAVEREERLIRRSAWLKAFLAGEDHEDERSKEEVIHFLIQLALFGKEAPEHEEGKELLSRAGIFDLRDARNLLIKMGVWEEDENLDLHRKQIQAAFKEKELEEARRLSTLSTIEADLEDIRNLNALTIDGPLTRDFDDALSLELQNGNVCLGVHIADVADVLLPESPLDRTAAERASSLYLPRRQIPMIPTDLSCEALSLKQGCDRRAISLLAHFDLSGNLLGYRFTRSLIRVTDNLTYQEVDRNIDTQEELGLLHKISQALRQKRKEQGSIILSLPELHINFAPDSSFSPELIPQDTPSRIMVAELMILYNWLLARLLRDNQVPTLYRTQPEPEERLSMDENDYLFYAFSQRRKLLPLLIDTSPKAHSILGVDVYTQATSPLRRYLDLVVQRQLNAFLTGKGSYYDEKDLDETRIAVEPRLKILSSIKRARIRYWVLKYLQLHKDRDYTALILYELKTKYRVLLVDFLLVSEIRRKPDYNLNPGERITVRVRKADPWEDLLELDYVAS